MIISETLSRIRSLLWGFLGAYPLTWDRYRQINPQKWPYPSLGGSGYDLPLTEKWKARRHDRRHPTRKKNLKEGQTGQAWKAAQRNPISRGDVTYECLPERDP